MISSGIFILPGLAYSLAGPAVILSYVLAGGLALVGIMSVAELATAMPKAGGDFYFVSRSLGPLAGTISGLLSWFAISLKTAFAIFGIAEVLHLVTGWPLLLFSAPACLFFAALNIVGVKAAARFEVMLVLGLLGMMTIYFAAGLGRIVPSHYTPLMPHGLNASLVTAGFIFVSFGGLLNIATVAEEVRNPARNIPLAFLTSVIVITVVYGAVLYVTVGLLPPEQLTGSLNPLAEAAKVSVGQAGYLFVSVAAMLAFVTTANAGIMSASRYPLAMGRDGLLPPFFCKVHQRLGTPVSAVAVTGLVIFLSLLLNLELLVKAASTVVLTTYVLASLAVIVLRHSHLQNYRPTFRVPGYPWLPAAGIVFFLLLIVDMGLATIEISMGLIFAGVLIYLFYGRRHSDQEYALLYVLQRLVPMELASYSLESELKAILHDRDELRDDAVAKALQEAGILDIEESCGRDELFGKAAGMLQTELPLGREDVLKLLLERESQASTALSDFTAVPHLLIPGEDTFKLLIARCRGGVEWTQDCPSVKAIFFICGTRDLRNRHLKTLSAIAHIVQHPEFEKKWLSVRHSAQLKDLMLLSDRKRH
jgi:basic amino acid/polyamine antiporter, APA family